MEGSASHLVEAYVALSFWSRTCTYILVDVEARTCRSRGAHIACTRTYSSEGARKKIRPRTYIRAGSRTPTRAHVHGWVRTEKQRRCRVHGEATKCVMFMGRQQNASCSSGGNGAHGSQPVGSERNVWSCSSGGLGRNRRWKRGLAYRTIEETDLLHSERGPVDREGRGVPQNGGETDFLRSKRGSC